MVPFDEIGEPEWDRVMSINVKGMWLATKATVRVMRAEARGRVIKLSSNAVSAGVPFMLHYVTSKRAVVAFTRALARELGSTGITVNAVAPGFTLTPGTLAIAEDAKLEEIQTRAVGQRAIRRDQEPSDCLGALVFLASDDSAFVTGQILHRRWWGHPSLSGDGFSTHGRTPGLAEGGDEAESRAVCAVGASHAIAARHRWRSAWEPT